MSKAAKPEEQLAAVMSGRWRNRFANPMPGVEEFELRGSAYLTHTRTKAHRPLEYSLTDIEVNEEAGTVRFAKHLGNGRRTPFQNELRIVSPDRLEGTEDGWPIVYERVTA